MSTTAIQLEQQTPTAGTWALDPAHSTVGFWARHLGLSKVRGHFGEFTADITVAEPIEDSRVEAVISTASIDTKLEMRDNHLRSADLLDVENNPEIRFTSTSVESRGDGTWDVSGDLSVRGVTNPATMVVEFHGEVEDPMSGTKRSGFSGSLEIDREDFGITWNGAIEIGGFVGKKVHIEIEAEALLQ